MSKHRSSSFALALSFSAMSVVSIAACSSNDGSNAAATADSGADGAFDDSPPAGDIDMTAEAANVGGHGASVTTTTAAKATSELFVHEDPTIDVTKTAGQNADAIAAQVTSSIAAACAKASIAHTTGSVSVSVAFNGDCTIGSSTYSGAVSASVSKAASGITIAFVFTSLVVDGTTINGTASETTSDDTTFSSQIALTVDTTQISFQGSLVLDADDGGITLNGTGSYQAGSTPQTTYTATSVHHEFGGCYANAGTLSYGTTTTGKSGKSYRVTESVTFNAQTPSTGMATATIAGVSSTITLPAHGSCPHS